MKKGRQWIAWCRIWCIAFFSPRKRERERERERNCNCEKERRRKYAMRITQVWKPHNSDPTVLHPSIQSIQLILHSSSWNSFQLIFFYVYNSIGQINKRRHKSSESLQGIATNFSNMHNNLILIDLRRDVVSRLRFASKALMSKSIQSNRILFPWARRSNDKTWPQGHRGNQEQWKTDKGK